MTRKQCPVDLVSACGKTTIDRLGFSTAFGFRYDHSEIVAALRTGPSEVYCHAFRLTLRCGPYNLAQNRPPKLATYDQRYLPAGLRSKPGHRVAIYGVLYE